MLRTAILSLITSLLTAAACHAQDGPILFMGRCATCHSANSKNHAPPPEVLKEIPWQGILKSLETGDMKEQGAALTPSQRTAVAHFAGKSDTSETPLAVSGFCAANTTSATSDSSWNGWGADERNTRFQSFQRADLSAAQVPELKLKWAFGFSRSAMATGQPTIVDGRIYLGSSDGTVYALDAKTGCIYWKFDADAMVRDAVLIGPGSRAYFGDLKSNFYALDASTGKLIWKNKIDEQPFTRITGTAKLYQGRLYVPVASQEENAAANIEYGCCTFRGNLVALDAPTGKVIWKSYTTPEPKPTRKSKTGVQYYGPSGATVWSSPTLDLKRKLLYVTTGNQYSDPPIETADAILAIDMETGAIRWSYQGSADTYNWNCEKWVSPGEGNCPANHGEDVDFGSSAILVDLVNGHQLVVAGQKSGVVHAVDPDQKGKMVWQTRIGKGSKYGGVLWGIAASDGLILAPLSDAEWSNPEAGGGLFALDAATGKIVWQTPAPKPACSNRRRCSAAQMAPPTAIAGVVFAGSMDGHLRAYDTKTGKIIWDFDAGHKFTTVDGVPGEGGAFSATGPTIVDGMLYVNSGHMMPGNVLLAFSVK